jgi:hypothetical protein
MGDGRRERLPLPEAVTHILEECRMVLPGIQALFGFQLISVFNEGFAQKLTLIEQYLHLLSIGLVAVAVALVMAPAAYHRQTSPEEVTENFIFVATRLLLYSMLPLMLGISLDFYLVSNIILKNSLQSFFLGVLLLAIFSFLWFLLPRLKKRS